ncbi:formate dehydrogenase N subunit beta transmembrane domain-containing protein, partial [Klebsiella grimontii]
GVGGTHVMYVLHHADKPNLYHGLPENPEISATVKFWKGIWKPLAAVGFAVTFAASIFHYVGVGPNRAEEEEDNLDEEKDEVRK